MPVSVVWYEGSLDADNRSKYATNTLLNNAMDRCEVGFVHRNGPQQLPSGERGCVCVLHGEHLAGRVEEIRAWGSGLDWILYVIMGDEPRIFNSRPLLGPRRKIWRQYPIPGKHDHEDRYLTAGYPADCPAFLEHLQKEMTEKKLNWSFMGQTNVGTRKRCVTQLKMLLHGYLYESPGFWLGLPRDEYYRRLAESKVVACPGGGAFPESLRMGEALEAGCIPIVEDCSFKITTPVPLPGGHQQKPFSTYWGYVLGEEPPFPTLVHWSDFPRLLDEALRGWPANRDRLQSWWKGYKAKMARWFEEDLRVNNPHA